MNYRDLFILTVPEVILTASALIILAVDLSLRRTRTNRGRMIVGAILSTLACIAAGAWIIGANVSGTFYDSMLVLNPLSTRISRIM